MSKTIKILKKNMIKKHLKGDFLTFLMKCIV